MGSKTVIFERGRPPLHESEDTVKFSLSMTESMRSRIEYAAQSLSESKNEKYNASAFVREAIEEKLERMGE